LLDQVESIKHFHFHKMSEAKDLTEPEADPESAPAPVTQLLAPATTVPLAISPAQCSMSALGVALAVSILSLLFYLARPHAGLINQNQSTMMDVAQQVPTAAMATATDSRAATASISDAPTLLTIPALLCFLGFVYRCYRFSQSDRKKSQENQRSFLTFGAILATFSAFLVFRPKPKVEPQPTPKLFITAYISENPLAAIMAVGGMLAMAGVYYYSRNWPATGGNHGRHRGHKRH